MDPAVELLKCEPCNRVFGTSKSLKQHYVMSSRHNSVDIKCGLCSATFKRKSNLTKHYHDKHQDLIGNVVNCAENQPEQLSTSTTQTAESVDQGTCAQASDNIDVPRLDECVFNGNDVCTVWGDNCDNDDHVCGQALDNIIGNGSSSDVAKPGKKKKRNYKHTSEYRYHLQATPNSNIFELYVKMSYDNPVVYDFEWWQTTDYPSTSSTSQNQCDDDPSAPCCVNCRHSLIERIGNLVKNSKNDKDPLNDSTILWLMVEAHNKGIIIDLKRSSEL